MVDVKALRPGALVRLVCGSPKMAVVGVRDTGLVEVVGWSDRIGVLRLLPARAAGRGHRLALRARRPTLASPGDDAMNPFPQLAQRIFNTPIAIHPDKAGIILGALAERLGVTQITVVGQGADPRPCLGRRLRRGG
jgi:hypothetical protein